MALDIRARALIAALAASLALAWPVALAPAQTGGKLVLAVHGGPEDFPGNASLDTAVRAVLRSQSAMHIDYHAEYLENEEFSFATAATSLRNYIAEKFQDRRIDLVIANTVPALEFVLEERDQLFPGAPVVFAASTPPEPVLKGQVPGVTGVLREVSHVESLDLALRLHPSTKHVYVVAYAPAVDGFHDRVRTSFAAFTNRVAITFMNQPTLPALLDAVKRAPADSLVFYLRYTPASPDRVVLANELIGAISEAAPVPMYSAVESNLGLGVVGGMMRSSVSTGTRIGEMALRILNGTPPEQIPVEPVPLAPIFDWRQLQRWTIDPARLPPESDIRFRVLTAWESYRPYIIGTVVIVLAQLALIAGLLTERASRRRAEETIRAREVSLRTSYHRIRQLAGRLINAQEAARASIAQDLHDDVCQKLAYVTMGVHNLKKSTGDVQDALTQDAISELERDTHNTFEGIRRLSHDLHPASLRVLGLAPALRSHCAEVAKRHDVEVAFTADGDFARMRPDVAVCFFRIAQESLRNGLVHGEARRFTVGLVRSAEDVEMTVSDDGRGFDLEAARRNGSGLGLVSMEERVHVVDGSIEIVTAPGKGTSVRVRGPALAAS